MRVERPDGPTVLLDMNAAPIRGAQGEVVAAVALFQDVTLAEARRRASIEFVANAAHELRTPLAAIVSGVEVLEAGAKDIPVERDRFLEHIAREAQRLVRLTRALLLLARIQSGVEDARAEVLELAPDARLGGGRGCAGGGSQGTGALPARRGGDRQPRPARAGADQHCRQRRPLHRGGADHALGGEAERQGPHPVRDTGRGMTPEQLARAGERFFRGDDLPARAASGWASRSPTRRSTRWAASSLLASEPGEGTTVDIELPGGPAGERRVTRVLVVDDEPALLDAVGYALRSEGFDVETATDGEQALQSLSDDASSSSCWTSCCRAYPGSRCAGACARRATCRSSC